MSGESNSANINNQQPQGTTAGSGGTQQQQQSTTTSESGTRRPQMPIPASGGQATEGGNNEARSERSGGEGTGEGLLFLIIEGSQESSATQRPELSVLYLHNSYNLFSLLL